MGLVSCVLTHTSGVAPDCREAIQRDAWQGGAARCGRHHLLHRYVYTQSSQIPPALEYLLCAVDTNIDPAGAYTLEVLTLSTDLDGIDLSALDPNHLHKIGNISQGTAGHVVLCYPSGVHLSSVEPSS